MTLTDAELTFVAEHSDAAMTTVTPAGVARSVRVSIAAVDGRIWSSGTASRVRTRRLREDPRSTLFVFDARSRFLSIESEVTILDGPDVGELSVRLFRQFQGRTEGAISWFGEELSEEAFRQRLIDDGRLIYQFEPLRTYGMI